MGSQIGHCQSLDLTLQLPQRLGDAFSLCTAGTTVQSDTPVCLSGHLIVIFIYQTKCIKTGFLIYYKRLELKFKREEIVIVFSLESIPSKIISNSPK